MTMEDVLTGTFSDGVFDFTRSDLHRIDILLSLLDCAACVSHKNSSPVEPDERHEPIFSAQCLEGFTRGATPALAPAP